MSEEVRGEAARLVQRLAVARERLDAVLAPRAAEVTTAGSANERTRIDDDEARVLLTPTADRVARLLGLARALADGTLSDESAAEAVRDLTATQPVRRPR